MGSRGDLVNHSKSTEKIMSNAHCENKYSLYHCIASISSCKMFLLDAQRNSNPVFPANCFLDQAKLFSLGFLW